MKTTHPEWLTHELRSQFNAALGSLSPQNPACDPSYIADAGLGDKSPAAPISAAEHGAHFACPHCETVLGVVSLPARGPCPACGGSLELSVNSSKLWQKAVVWLPWFLTLLMIVVIVWGVILIGSRLGLASLDVESYDSVSDNRFVSWPWSLRANEHCRIPPDAITGIGWDSRGGSHALIDQSFVVITHNTPPEKLFFSDGEGEVYCRKVVSRHTLSTDAEGLPWIRLCRLDSPLPDSIRPLPILELSGHSALNLPLLMVGRYGRVGSETSGSVSIIYRMSDASTRLSSIGAFHTVKDKVSAGDAKLRVGDSGTPLIARAGNNWCLVGLACAIAKSAVHKHSTDIHIHALLYPQLDEMKLAGAKPSAVRLTAPDPSLFVTN
ncbi:MAG: hypothetical protein RLZZ505_600 [Verrucomicrobiota bacterium]|jgi:hypothetical protein